MAIAHEAFNTANTGTTAVSLTCNKPTGTAEGDVLVAVIGAYDNASTTAPAITPPAGWVALDPQTYATYMTHQMFYKVAGASEGASYQFDFDRSSRASMGMSRFSGCDATPSDATPAYNTGTTANPVGSSVTTATNGAMLLLGITLNTSTREATSPDGMAEAYETGSYAEASLHYVIQASAGASGNKTATLNISATWVTSMWALQPAAAGATVVASRRSLLGVGV